ncbi:MAG TPA: ROK family protein [Pyrinomonadaceae bacterium]|nr:ROK family protein [Pyrinomonadaceae bacterium]
MPTVHDVARLAGVSTATVSHVINKTKRVSPKTTQQVQIAITQLNFVPNPLGRLLALRKIAPPSLLPSLRTSTNHARPTASDESTAQDRSLLTVLTQTDGRLRSISGASNETTRAMLRMVRVAQPISRADLARRLQVHRSTITEMVKPLVASGLLREAAPARPREGAGRSSIGLSFREERSFFIGVNIGVRRSQVCAALVDGEILGEESFDTPEDSKVALAQVRAGVDRLRASLSGRAISAIGVSVPGPVNAARTHLLFGPQLGWRDVAVANALRIENPSPAQILNREVPVVVENDATAAALYERGRLLARNSKGEFSDFVLVRVGTGIGVGLVLGGAVYRGTGAGRGLPGEFGHMTIVAGGKPCVCGNRGCWERYASAASAASLYAGERLHARGGSHLRFVDIVAKAEAGETRARVTLERIGDYLGIGIGNIISGLGIPRIVVSGRIVFGWRFIEDSLRDAVARTMVGRLATWSIEAGEPTGSGLGGALEVAIEQHLTSIVTQLRPAE